MKIGRKFFKIRSREINSSAIILMSSVMCCTDFRDCRMCSPGLGRGGWPRLVGRSIRDNTCPAAIQAQLAYWRPDLADKLASPPAPVPGAAQSQTR